MRDWSRISIAAVIFAGTLVLLAAPARAGEPGVVTDRPLEGPTSAQEVREYWTAQRMREATPVDVPAPRAPTAGAAATDSGDPPAGAAAVEQPSTTAYPNRIVGKVFFNLPGRGNFVCSGSVINTRTDSFVLTAGHCVEDGGVFADRWMFAPGYRDGATPFGEWVAAELSVPSLPGLSFDHGAAIVTGPGGQSVEDVVGAFGIALFEPPSQQWRAYGYPAAAPFDGGRLFTCESPTVLTDTGLLPAPIGIRCDMTAGSSGGPWVIQDVLVASNSSYRAPDEAPALLFGPPFDAGAAELFDAAHPAKCAGRAPSIVGTEDDDRLVGTKRGDVILGDDGDDVIIGKGGKDRVCGEKGKDKLRGGKRRDVCVGGPGRDKATGCEKRKRV